MEPELELGNLLSIDGWRKLANHSSVRKYAGNFGYALAGRVVGLIGSFFVGALVARYLGPERYGVLNYAVSFVLIFAFIASLGIDSILVRELLHRSENQLSILNIAFFLKLLGAGAVIIIILLASLLFQNSLYLTTIIFLYSLQLVPAALFVLDYFFQSESQFRFIFWAQLCSTIGVSILRLFFIFAHLGTGWFVLALVFESTLYGLILIIFFKRYTSLHLNLRVDSFQARELLRQSWPFLITSVFYFLYSRIDQVMIGKMLGSKDLGIYSAAVKLAEVWYLVPTLLCSIFLPPLIRAHSHEKGMFRHRANKFIFFLILISTIFALFEFVFAKSLVSFVFGTDFAPAAGVLSIYTWAGIFISLIFALNQELVIERRTWLIVISSATGALLNIILNFYFIPRFGNNGAALATLISYGTVPLIIILGRPFGQLSEPQKLV